MNGLQEKSQTLSSPAKAPSPGIFILTSRPTESVYPPPSLCNAPARFLSAEPFRRCGENTKAQNSVSQTHFSDTFPSPIRLGTEIPFGRCPVYPVGNGSAAILPSVHKQPPR